MRRVHESVSDAIGAARGKKEGVGKGGGRGLATQFKLLTETETVSYRRVCVLSIGRSDTREGGVRCCARQVEHDRVEEIIHDCRRRGKKGGSEMGRACTAK